MRLALFRQLSAAEQKKVTEQNIKEIRESYQEMCQLGVWHSPPKGFPKKINNFILWERKDPAPLK